MLGTIKNKRLIGCLLLYFLAISVFVGGCLSIIEFNRFDFEWNRAGSTMAIDVVGTLTIDGYPTDSSWTDQHAFTAIQLPDQWSGITVETYAVTETSGVVIRYDTLTWHSSKAVAEMAEKQQPAEKGHSYWGFESDQTLSFADIEDSLYGGKYEINYTYAFSISNAPNNGIQRAGWIMGDEFDGLWSGRSFMVDGEVPTLTQWGLIILVVLIAASAVFIMVRRKRAAVPA
jgi:hypothetical protein